MNQIAFTIPIDPIELARPKFSHGRAYLPPRSRSYRQAVQALVKTLITRDKISFLTGELFCSVKFFRRFKPTAPNFGDIDNHVKAILDALQGLIFDDDRQIVSVAASKLKDCQNPRIEIVFRQN